MQEETQVGVCVETRTEDAKLWVALSLSGHPDKQAVCACSRKVVLWG